MALLFTARTERQANSKSFSVCALTGSPETCTQLAALSPGASIKSLSCKSAPPDTGRSSTGLIAVKSHCKIRIEGFFISTSSASASNAGAIKTSVNILESGSAIAKSTLRLAATTPPNAETGSHSWAFK